MVPGTMADNREQLWQRINRAVETENLRADSRTNIRQMVSGDTTGFYARVIDELVEAGEWAELNDRFYKTLAFGTGGLRGRTIGRIVTKTERGTPTPIGRPEFPCVGTNAMNYFNISRATQGLVRYINKWRVAHEPGNNRAKLVIAYDTRHFSREFAELAAKIVSRTGSDAFVFEAPRSTPELSFAVRYLNADAGIVITASHNPPYDNGYKVYFNDGAQVIEPHATGIIAEVNAINSELITESRDAGEFHTVGAEIDRAYVERLETLILNPDVLAQARDLKTVYTPLHGTGGVILKPMFKKLGINFLVVAQQDQFDGRFPTVKSPNPENAEALKLGIELAERANADFVIGTDPDCDRIGVAAHAGAGTEFQLLSGNQIGSLLTYYRVKTLFDRGVLNEKNAAHAVIIKTFVTTDLQKAVAEKFGLRCVETLTGFKYIGAKLGKYERALGDYGDYRKLPEQETRQRRLRDSAFYVFGGEESYGYSGADFVRDKDGNGAAIMFCEVAAWAKTKGQTVLELLDSIYAEFGYFAEKNASLVFEGADGAEKIRRLLLSYDQDTPTEMLGLVVTGIRNFDKQEIKDVEGDVIPKEKLLIFDLANKTRVAVRGSGTEPKVKYYLFGQRRPSGKSLAPSELAAAKTEIRQHLDALWDWLEADAHQRLAK